METQGVIVSRFTVQARARYKDKCSDLWISRFAILPLAIFVASAARAQALPEQKSNPGKAAIDGILLDTQTNPIPMAEVWLINSRLNTGSQPEITPVITGDDGAFHFEGLVPGQYSFRMRHDRFKPDLNEIPTFDLHADERLTGVRFTAYVPAVISGTVVDDEGDPLESVTVEVLQYVTQRSRRILINRGNATTDDRGSFRISGLRPGAAYVHATFRPAASYVSTSSYLPVYFPNAADREHARPIEVIGGTEYKAINLLMIRGKTYSIRGRAFSNTAGKLPSPSFVQLLSADSTGVQRVNDAIINSSDGTFVIRNVMPGDYTIDVGGSPFVFYSLSEGPPTCVPFANAQVRVNDSDVNDVILRATCPGTLNGTVALEDGTPIQARISFTYSEPSATLTGGSLVVTVQSDSNGHFEAPQMRPGKHFVTATTLDRWTYLAAVNGNAVDPSEPPLVLVAGGSPGNAQIVLSAHPARVGGNLRGLPGGSEGRVALWPAEAKVWNAELVRIARVGADGRYLMEGIAPGKYHIAAWAVGTFALDAVLTERLFLHSFESLEDLITLTPDAAETLDLLPNPSSSAADAIARLL